MEKPTRKFGTFGGVFTPSILTILGVILFLRAGYVLGEGGVAVTVLILIISEAIVLLTAVSVAAIATNTKVEGGGAYFLISRVLGPEFGGAIGLALFLAQALSVPFYILGFAEALENTVPWLAGRSASISYLTTAALFTINCFGAGWAIKAQYIIMTILGLALFSFLGGAALLFDGERFATNLSSQFTSEGISFWSLFAIYFPAVTGIMAGVNMSGDLKNPGRSLVRGTFAAIVFGGAIYLAEILIFGGAFSREALVSRPYETLLDNALFGTWYLVAAGVFAATLSSALGSFMGAPRILQALSSDRIFTWLKPFAHGTGKSAEPLRALSLTLVLALVVIYPATREASQGAFNIIASVVTMFFLLTYSIVNLAAFVESVGSNPSFRPRFRLFHWSTALAGTLCCVVVMFLIDWTAALIAAALVGGLYWFISRRVVETTFGDARRGFVYAAAAKNLFRLQDMPVHAKNWRPNILVLSGQPEKRLNLVRFGVWFEAGRGIVSLIQLLRGDLVALTSRRTVVLESLRRFIREQDLNVFPEVVVASDFDEGVRTILQTHSLDPVKPNLVLLGWPREETRIEPFFHHMRTTRMLGKSVLAIIDRGLPAPWTSGVVDVWWRGKENGSLMVILADLLTENWEWERCRIRILRVVENESGRLPARQALEQLAEAARIEAEAVIVVSKAPFEQTLYQYSRTSSLVMLGLDIPETNFQALYERMGQLVEGLPTTVLVSSSGEADLLA